MGGKGGECKCDNNTVVMVIKHGYTKEKHMAHLLWCLFFLEAKFNVTLVTTHVPGAKNLVADALSYNRLMEFFYFKFHRPGPGHLRYHQPRYGQLPKVDDF